MIIVLLGAPGAGKGTQADLLVKEFGYRKLSTGDALRSQVRQGTQVGKAADGFMQKGQLVPDDVLLGILQAELGDNPKEVILLDGYPRNRDQAKALEELGSPHRVKQAIHLDVPRTELIERISGRRTCPNCGASYHMSYNRPKVPDVCDRCNHRGLTTRSDDSPEKVEVRLGVYEQSTKPVLEFYKERGIYQRIDGNRSPEAIFEDLKSAVALWV